MGAKMKPAIFEEKTSQALAKWVQKAEMRKALRVAASGSNQVDPNQASMIVQFAEVQNNESAREIAPELPLREEYEGFHFEEREGSGSSNFPEPQSKPAIDTQSISGIELQMLTMNHVVFWLNIDAWKEEEIQGVARRSNEKEKKKSRGSHRTRRLVSSWPRATFVKKEITVPKRSVARRSVIGSFGKLFG
ncbi:hypothetical protein L3X38_031675 [Prunus dulcis]|uniref:Uncharacterized protein n=1 Tax=Prunus dulcis TaxID=3755 RepID=A0AAD4VDP1_PRUDU|nr:hypothetical protein L3X38_031675 [Prunus dulcis]